MPSLSRPNWHIQEHQELGSSPVEEDNAGTIQ